MWRSIALLCLCACASKPRQYTLHVDLANQENSVLCEHDVKEKIAVPKDGVSAAADTHCPRYGNQPLSAPATLTIKLENGQAGAKYDLRIEQSTREASKADVTDLLAVFSGNAERLVRGIAPTEDSAEQDGLVKRVLKQAADVARDRAPGAAAALLTKSQAAEDDDAEVDEEEDEETRSPKQKFKGYIDEQTKTFRSAAATRTGVRVSAVNEPNDSTPPPRDSEFTQEDLEYLKKEFALGPDKVADFVLDWCTVDTFIPAGNKDRFDELVATEARVGDVAKLLKLDKTQLARILLGKGNMAVIEEQRTALIDSAKNWGTASKEAKAYWFMRIGNNLELALDNCAANINTLSKVVPAAKKTKLENARQGIRDLATAAGKWSKVFIDLFTPFFRDAVTVIKKEIELSDAKLSTTVSLEPGELEFGVGKTGDDGEHQEIATFKSRIKGVERLAIVLGPVATVCWWGCFDTIEEIVVQPTDTMAAGRRTLQKSRANYDMAVATALHLTMISRGDWGLGPVLGYPLGAADDTSTNVLVGVGARHASGFELVLGAHGLRAPEFKDGYGPVIDLGLDGNQGLTADSVRNDRVTAGVFVLIAFAPNLSK